ncbi:MAG: response regulator [Longimicrobiales bacterium]|nr:response regulator [Longimicrobiales bacterium]
MADRDGLTPSGASVPPAVDPAGAGEWRAAPSGEPPEKGSALFWAVTAVMALPALVAGLAGVAGVVVPAPNAPALLLALESASATLALGTGMLALVRYYTRQRRSYLFVGSGFLATGVLEILHLGASPLWAQGAVAAPLQNLLSWSWLLSRGFPAVFFFLSLQAGRSGSRLLPTVRGERGVYGMAAAALAATVAAACLVPAPRVTGPGVLASPLELVPAALFLATAYGYLARGDWRRDVFERWFTAGMLAAALVHLLYTVRTGTPSEAAFMVGQALKGVGHLVVLVGVLMGVRITFRREEEALAGIRDVNRVLGREIAVRREAEAVLQRSEERLQSFLETAHDLILSADPDGRLLYVNAAWERTLGYTRDEALTLRIEDLVHPGHRKGFAAQYRRVLAEGAVPGMEVDFLTRGGQRVSCSGSATRLVVDGETAAVQAIFRDVTEQRRAERGLATSQASLEAVVESTGDSIWSVDAQMRLVTFNTAFALALEARSGREPRAGDAPQDLFDPEDAAWYRDLYTRVLGGERFSELRHEPVAGPERLFEIFCHPIAGAEGIAGAVMFGKDVTRRVQAEEALRMAKEEAEGANRAKSQFLANMSHELRTPLNSVIGFANVLLKNRGGNLSERDLGFIDRIVANGRHLLSLINEVLDLAKIEAGRMELDLHPVDLAELVQETALQLEGQAQERAVTLTWSAPEGLEPVETDRAKLKQVLINLLGNALKFSPEGEVTVTVEATAGGRPTALAVTDTGIGIPEDRLQAIFEAFQQADGSTARRYGGTGLGLAISRSICQTLGYDLTVRSRVGEGSTFSIVLDAAAGGSEDVRAEDGAASSATPSGTQTGTPGGTPARDLSAAVAEAPARPGAAESGPAAVQAPDSGDHAAGFTVLVVDDEADSRVLMGHYLRDLGCRVLSATSAEEGLGLARTHRPDLITLDLRMPGMSGWEMLERLKDDPVTRAIPVVVVSIVAQEGRGRLLGAVDLLTKPVEREDLLRVLWRNLVRRRGGRILVVHGAPDDRDRWVRFAREVGLEATAAPDGREALRMVEEDAPDLVLLNLVLPVMDGLSFLTHLRENPYYRGLPALVLTDRDLTRSEQVALEEKASAVLRTGEGDEDRLRDTLERILPLTPDSGAPEGA